jgi:acetolactate synthase-1/2/3 large subunit
LIARDYPGYDDWLAFCCHVKDVLPSYERFGAARDGYVDPYVFYERLSEIASSTDVIVPSSSGCAHSVAMQVLEQRIGQVILTHRGRASTGCGLAGAIGAAMAWPEKRAILIEGDGSFIHSSQELGTIAVNRLNLKLFVLANEGYAALRVTQKQHFGRAYLGCDRRSGLGLPSWAKFFDAYGIPVLELEPDRLKSRAFEHAFETPGPHAFIVPVDPKQSNFTNPTSPALDEAVASDVLRYLMAEAPERVAG